MGSHLQKMNVGSDETPSRRLWTYEALLQSGSRSRWTFVRVSVSMKLKRSRWTFVSENQIYQPWWCRAGWTLSPWKRLPEVAEAPPLISWMFAELSFLQHFVYFVTSMEVVKNWNGHFTVRLSVGGEGWSPNKPDLARKNAMVKSKFMAFFLCISIMRKWKYAKEK